MNKLNKIIAIALVTFSLQSFADDCPALSGELTIGTSEGSDFTTISEAADALKCGGVDGPITFYIESGTYPERVVFTHISGSSAYNTVHFASQSGISSDVVISYMKSDATLVLIGSSHISFENITVDHKDATYGNCMRVEGESNDLHFKKMVFNGVEMPRTGFTNATAYFTPAGSKTRIVFDECEINNGSIGISKGGASATSMDSKTSISGTSFFNQAESGIALSNEDAPVISNNTINTLSTSEKFIAIQLDHVSNQMVISRNAVNTSNSARGLLIHDCMAQSSAPGKIMNNTFGIGGSRDAYGMQITGTTGNQVMDYNTIKLMVNAADASKQAYYINSSSGQNISMANSTYYDLNKGSYIVYSDSYKTPAANKTSSSLSASAEGLNMEKGTVIK